MDLLPKLENLAEKFSGSRSSYVLADLYNALRGESPLVHRTRPLIARWTRYFSRLTQLAGPELLGAILRMMCPDGTQGQREEDLPQTMRDLIEKLDDLRYLTSPFWVFDNDEVRELEEELPKPAIVPRFAPAVENLSAGHEALSGALRGLKLGTLWSPLPGHEALTGEMHRKGEPDMRATEFFTWSALKWITRVQ
jgi:hypothetical protein